MRPGAHKTSATVVEDDQREDLGGYPVRYPACGQGRIAPSPTAGWGGLPTSAGPAARLKQCIGPEPSSKRGTPCDCSLSPRGD